jgi:RNA recognition motif-containing protein
LVLLCPTLNSTKSTRKSRDYLSLILKLVLAFLQAPKKSNGKAPATPKTPAAAEEEEGGSSTIFVKNLAWKVDSDSLFSFFQDCGEVTDVRIAQGEDGRSRGFGHIEFGTPAAAKKVSGCFRLVTGLRWSSGM